MATPNESLPPAPQWTSHALEWGAGSILIGILVLLTIPLAVVATAIGLGMFIGVGGLLTVDNIGEVFIGVEVVVGFLMLMAVLGLCFGIQGVRQARARRLPAGLAATGLVICLILALGLGVGFVFVLDCHRGTMEHIRGRGPFPKPVPNPRH
jgi:hypothetical protein